MVNSALLRIFFQCVTDGEKSKERLYLTIYALHVWPVLIGLYLRYALQMSNSSPYYRCDGILTATFDRAWKKRELMFPIKVLQINPIFYVNGYSL